MRTPPPAPDLPALDALPGHQIRRLQQIAVGLFMDETASAGLDVTPVQYAVLATVARQPGIDQRTLARTVGFDTSTVAGVVERLERRELLRRQPAPEDRRLRRLALTPAGTSLLASVLPAMRRAQHRILAPLPAAERRRFMTLLDRLVAANNGASRAPSQPG
jgi:DNA-binding MarR family transcriptional regulator